MVKQKPRTKVTPLNHDPVREEEGKDEVDKRRRRSSGDDRRKSKDQGQDQDQGEQNRARSADDDVPNGVRKKSRRGTLDSGFDKDRRKSSADKGRRNTTTDQHNRKDSKDRRRSTKNEKDLEEARKLLILREEEKERRRSQKKEQQLEKELKKKMAYHHIDKDEVQDSEESIYIAPPAPENHISVVNLVVCGVKGYRKCLVVCAALQFIATITQFVVLFTVDTFWPLGFALEFHVKNVFINSRITVLVTALQPIFILLWLILVILISRRSRICCCRNKSLWFLRGYYLYSPLLLVIPLMLVILYILFVGRLNLDELEKTMFKHLNLYDAKKESKENWDETQKYFECCGVDSDGWRNWEQREKVEEDFVDWIVPSSCCRKNVNHVQCMNETIDDFVWNDGCLKQAYTVYVTYGNVVICALVATIVLSVRPHSIPNLISVSVSTSVPNIIMQLDYLMIHLLSFI